MIFKPNFLGLRGGSNIPRDGLVAEYLFSGNALDTSGNGNNGSVPVSGVTLTTDRFNNPDSAYLFSGGTLPNGVISVPYPFSTTGDIEFSLCAWVNCSNISTSRGILRYGNNSSALQACSIYSGIGGNGRISSEYAGGNGYRTTFTIAENNWYFIVCTKTSGAINTNSTIYINGVEISPSSSSTSTPNIQSVSVNTIGAFSSDMFLGKIDDVRIYERALSLEEVILLYNEGT